MESCQNFPNSIREDAKPVDVYELEGYGGFHTLNVYADGNYHVATADYGRDNNSNPIKAFQAFSTVVYGVIGYDPVSGESIWGDTTSYWKLQFNIAQSKTAVPTIGWAAW